ncbi:hypothetical protein [Anaerosinus gibii]|uniref:Uncharacterized protein n=1 Tax=Selenobaculum gibii TaxID=3054208 RepID=A0A9Y2AFU7_9FIRM|nr:hypothetical protein [Selenobaculum gbiensis]WIW70885.1 hypothetical protein P3F81_00745 [Selenobaculum gbiensis]
MQDKKSIMIADSIMNILKNYFREKIDGFVISDATDIPYNMFSIEFRLYNYFPIILNYDRGSFGCAISYGEQGIALENSQRWYDEADMNVFVKELDEQIKLRIPDKFLDYYGWK